jgi:alkyldihydroxyacetonephosphate synthase
VGGAERDRCCRRLPDPTRQAIGWWHRAVAAAGPVGRRCRQAPVAKAVTLYAMTDRLRWADDDAHLPDHLLAWLRRETGGSYRPTPPADPAGTANPAGTAGTAGTANPAGTAGTAGTANPAGTTGTAGAGSLPEPAAAALAGTGAAVHTDSASRLAHAGGMKYLDLLRRRRGEGVPLPDAVVEPAAADQVEAVLRACAAHGIAVVPFGGGTSVVGGVDALRGGHRAVVALDLRRLDRLIGVDRESMTATLQAGMTGPAAEAALARHGLTLGHFPQSFERATIGGFAATRSAGQASGGYGTFAEMVQGLRLATPAGWWTLGRAPHSAAGPDLRHLVLGSEGAFGVITEVTVRVRPVPAARRYEGWAVPSFAAGAAVLRRLAQDDLLPDVARLSDRAETRVGNAAAGRRGRVLGGYLAARRRHCLLVLGWEGTGARVAGRRRAALPVLRAGGAIALGRAVGEAWRRGRYAGPRQRDALLDAGALVETVETATTWSRLRELHEAVGAALRCALGGRPVVMCHLSHAYPTGASLYFTVLAAQDPTDPAGQWERAKHATGQAIAAGQATITHHHAVGTDHAPWLAAEIGDLGIGVLRAVKARLDPAGILNPGKLLPGVQPGTRTGETPPDRAQHDAARPI